MSLDPLLLAVGLINQLNPFPSNEHTSSTNATATNKKKLFDMATVYIAITRFPIVNEKPLENVNVLNLFLERSPYDQFYTQHQNFYRIQVPSKES